MGTNPATIQQLIDAGTDCETIASVATKQETSTTDRLGVSKLTLYGITQNMAAKVDAAIGAAGYEAGVPYSAGIVISRNRQTVLVGTNRYFPARSLPFTTGATFVASEWYQMGGFPDFSGTGGNITNTIIGLGCFSSNTTGKLVSAFGADCLKSATSSERFVAMGFASGQNVSVGIRGVLIGAYAGFNNTTANGCTALGHYALGSNVSFNNCTAIGAESQVTAANQVQLGDSATTTYVYGTVQNRSDIRDKTDVTSTSLGLSFITSLRPVDYRWDMREDYIVKEIGDTEDQQDREIVKLSEVIRDGSKKRLRKHHGFIAQEVGQQFPEFGGYQDHKITGGEDVLSLGYDEFIAPMVKAIQELYDIVKTQQLEINELKGEA